MQRRKLFPLAALGAAMLVIAAPSVRACGCGALPIGLIAQHPRSISVAFAVRDAIDAGLLAQPDIAVAKGAAGVLRLSTLYRSLNEAANTQSPGAPAFALLLIDSGLTHTTGATAPGVFIVTHEAALLAILEGRLPIAAALERNLLVIDGDEPQAADLKQRLLASL